MYFRILLYCHKLPEVPRTDRTFLFFLGVTSGILCATVYFFFSNISGPFSHNLDWSISPRSRFFEFLSVFFWLYSTGIICRNIILKSILGNFCELLFHFLTFLVVSEIEKNSKKRFLGSMTRSKLCENGPDIVEKKNTLLHIVSRT
jgi:hypothetical protein